MVTASATYRRTAAQNAEDVALLKQHFNQSVAENDTKRRLILREGA